MEQSHCGEARLCVCAATMNKPTEESVTLWKSSIAITESAHPCVNLFVFKGCAYGHARCQRSSNLSLVLASKCCCKILGGGGGGNFIDLCFFHFYSCVGFSRKCFSGAGLMLAFCFFKEGVGGGGSAMFFLMLLHHSGLGSDKTDYFWIMSIK